MADTETDFDAWLAERFGAIGPFTVLIVLVAIGDASVDLLRSTHLHVIGTDVTWDDLATLFAGSGVAWNGAAFIEAAATGESRLVPDDLARRQLSGLVSRLHEDRLVLNEGQFFDRLGRRLAIEETTLH